MAAGGECDELESWEEMENFGVLDKKLEKLKAAMSTSLQKDFRSGGSGKNDTVVFLAEDGRTRYVPPEPTVKILKRPPILSSSHNAGGDGFITNGDSSMKPKQPIKSLQQRELEYAEARLRILGEAQSPDERPALLERIRRIQNKSESVVEAEAEAEAEAVAVAVEEPTGLPVYSGPGPVTNSASALASPSVSNSAPIMSPQPMIIMTSTSAHLSSVPSQPHGTALGNCVGGAGQYNVGASAAFNNGCAKAVPFGNRLSFGYGGANSGSLQNHVHPNSYAGVYGATGNPPPPSTVFTSAGIINASVVSPVGNNFLTIQAPISLNLAIRQPRGPDGTKGFHNFRPTLR